MSPFPHPRRAAISVAGFVAFATALSGVAACDRSRPPTAAPTTGFGGTDLAWIEITIAMDEQIEPLLALAPAHSRDAKTQAVAQQVHGFTATELTRLRALHDQAGLPSANPHEGMPMPGLVSADTVHQASSLNGAAFDRLARDQIRAHLQQGQKLATSEQKAGTEQRTRALAADVIQTRTKALELLP